MRQLLSLCILLSLFSGHVSAADDSTKIPEFSATYVLKKGPMELAEMERRLSKQPDGGYHFYTHSKPIGIAKWFTNNTLTEESFWHYEGEHLRPQKYIYDRKGSKKRYLEMNFDWQNKRVATIVNQDKPWKMDIDDGAQDKLLYQLSLMHDLRLGKHDFVYQVADGGSMKEYTFRFIGEETIETKMGQLETLKFVREGSRLTTIWCAPSLGFIPVRLEQGDDRGNLRLSITHIQGIRNAPQSSHLATPPQP